MGSQKSSCETGVLSLRFLEEAGVGFVFVCEKALISDSVSYMEIGFFLFSVSCVYLGRLFSPLGIHSGHLNFSVNECEVAHVPFTII